MTAPLDSIRDPIIVNVALGDRAYDIVIGRGCSPSLGARDRRAAARRAHRHRHRRTVAKHWLEQTEASLADGRHRRRRASSSTEGEGSKSYAGT